MSQNETDPDTLADSGSGPEHDLAVAVSHLPDPHSVEFTMKIRGGAYDRLEVSLPRYGYRWLRSSPG